MIAYRIYQDETDGGIWESEVFEAPTEHAIKQAVIAGWLFGYRRWAKAIDGSFTWGLSRKGEALRFCS